MQLKYTAVQIYHRPTLWVRDERKVLISICLMALPCLSAHYDDSVRDAVTGHRSEWTLLVYLSGVEDGVAGGEVFISASTSIAQSMLT